MSKNSTNNGKYKRKRCLIFCRNAILNAVNLLVRNDTAIPFSLYDSTNPYCVEVFKMAGKFSISSAAEYANFVTAANTSGMNAGATVMQTKNISLAGYPNLRIGNGSNPFAATYDGQGHTISDVVINSSANYNAMFVTLSGSIKNLTIENANVIGDGWSAILVSVTKGNNVVLDNVHVKNSIFTKTATNNGGGILICQPNSDTESYTVKNSSVTNCNIYVQGTVSNIGLIASRGRSAACVIDNCITSGNSIYGQTIHNVGFINGEFEAGTVSNCLALGNTLYGTCSAVGIFGATKKGTINLTNCTSDMTNISGKTSEEPAATITNTGFTTISKDAITANLYNKDTATPGYVSGFNADGTAQFVEHADHKTSGKITVAAGDIVYFGPCNEGQSFHARFRSNNGSVVKVTKNELLTTGRFAQGQVIYAYKAPADGAIYVVNNVNYDDDFVVTKNQLMTVQTYYNYVDSLEDWEQVESEFPVTMMTARCDCPKGVNGKLPSGQTFNRDRVKGYIQEVKSAVPNAVIILQDMKEGTNERILYKSISNTQEMEESVKWQAPKNIAILS